MFLVLFILYTLYTKHSFHVFFFFSEEEKESLKDDIHKPAENWGEKAKQEKIKERLEKSKQKRQVAEKLKY